MTSSTTHGLSEETLAFIERRENEILGKRPRFAAPDRERIADAVTEETNKLRKDLFGNVPTIEFAQVPEIMVTMHPFGDLWQRIIALSLSLMGPGCKMSGRDQKLVILRISWLLGAPYEFGEHIGKARAIGVTQEEVIAIIEQGSSSLIWSDHERALLRAAEELHSNAFISDETWSTLSATLDQQQMFELIVLIGQFTSVAYFQNSLRLQIEDGKSGLAGAKD